MTATYLVFGDLHGRILPAFRLALAWSAEHGERVDALLQVGDLGWFPDPTRLDAATRRHAARDPLELGAQLLAAPSGEADEVLVAEDPPFDLYFTAGNHEDFAALTAATVGCDEPDVPVDAYRRVRLVRDGEVATLPGGLRVGALWGIDDEAPRARRAAPPEARIRWRSAVRLAGTRFEVLLAHDGPRDVVFADAGSAAIDAVLEAARPAFAFFGHYRLPPGLAAQQRAGALPTRHAATRVVHLAGLTLRRSAEPGSVGVLRWGEDGGSFQPLDRGWLASFTRARGCGSAATRAARSS